MKTKIFYYRLLIALLAFRGVAVSQNSTPQLTVGYVLPNNGNFNSLSKGGEIAFPDTSINAATTVVIVVSNRGSGTGYLSSVTVTGATFQVIGLPALPAAVSAGSELRFGLTFSPTVAGTQSGTLALGLPDGSFFAQLTGATAAPSFKLNYYFQTDGNVSTLNSGDGINFPATKVNATTTAVLGVANYGHGGGFVNSISLTGSGFRLLGVSPLPILVDAGKALQFSVAYSPTHVETSTGVLTIGLDSQTLVVNLSGTATGPIFTYAIVNNGSLSSFSAGDTVPMPDTAVGQTTNLTVQISNTGNGDGTIAGIALNGQGYQLSNLPIFPAILPANGNLQFTLSFTPATSGVSIGHMQIGPDAFNLSANGTGPKLQYSYTVGAGSISVQPNQTVFWGSVQVGGTSTVQFVVANQGNAAATISSVAIVDARSAYAVTNLPVLPVSVAPGDQILFSVAFAPMALGDNVSHLRIDAQVFNLLGSGTAPPPLPAVQITGPTQALDAMQQPALAVTLASPYPLPLSGTLTLSVTSNNFAVDPAVQFATGGRSVAFTIPANSTTAKFPGGSNIRFQTGTVAGTINITAALATQSGVNVTPDTPPSINLEIPAAPPRVLDVQFGAQTANSFTLVITGLSTTRSLTQLDLDFTSSSKYNVPTGHFTFNIQSVATDWYRTSGSQTFGSLFTATVSFGFQAPSGSSLAALFQSISATLSNEMGKSSSFGFTPQP